MTNETEPSGELSGLMRLADEYAGPEHDSLSNRRSALQSAIAAALTQRQPDPEGRYLDGVEVDRLASALSWLGCSTPESRESLAFRIPEFVNNLTRAVMGLKDKFAGSPLASQPALVQVAGDASLPVVGWMRVKIQSRIDLPLYSQFANKTCSDSLVKLADAQTALAAKDAGHAKQLQAANAIIASLQARNATLQAGRAEWQEAVKTLQSERDANSILTAEIARLTTERDGLKQVIGTVCEGWTLPHDARKVLESALWTAMAKESGK